MDAGEIFVLGGKPGTRGSGVPGKRVGYMPQEIALYGEFSIQETMMYFGWIFGMETKEILERLQFLLNFLDLPSEKRLVKNLSGGQQRRVSFAVALMHDPELLILDEPTVGVDPLLRQSIWNHLVHITKAGQKTVIITTHYIEEARQAHTVWFIITLYLKNVTKIFLNHFSDWLNAIGSPAGRGVTQRPALHLQVHQPGGGVPQAVPHPEPKGRCDPCELQVRIWHAPRG